MGTYLHAIYLGRSELPSPRRFLPSTTATLTVVFSFNNTYDSSSINNSSSISSNLYGSEDLIWIQEDADADTDMMGILSFLRDERTVLVGLGLTTASFVCAMRFALEHYRDEAEVRPSKPKTQYITQDTEDALKRDTLETLLQHYNFSIRETALKIVAGRAVNDRAAVERLLLGITRPDYDERERCLRALAFAVEDGKPLSPLSPPLLNPSMISDILAILT